MYNYLKDFELKTFDRFRETHELYLKGDISAAVCSHYIGATMHDRAACEHVSAHIAALDEGYYRRNPVTPLADAVEAVDSVGGYELFRSAYDEEN